MRPLRASEGGDRVHGCAAVHGLGHASDVLAGCLYVGVELVGLLLRVISGLVGLVQVPLCLVDIDLKLLDLVGGFRGVAGDLIHVS